MRLRFAIILTCCLAAPVAPANADDEGLPPDLATRLTSTFGGTIEDHGLFAIRHIAKNLVAAGLCDEVLVQVSYAIGVAEPTSINVNTYGTANIKMNDSEIAKKVSAIFDMRPYFIETRLKLRNPIYSETAAYGHMGRKPQVVDKTFVSPEGRVVKKKVELFTWEKLDYVNKIKKEFGLK